MGYAPAEWEALTRHLRGRGFTEQELLTGGLATQGRRGAMDRFRGRLIWPIRDLTGDVIAFGARKLNPDEDGPKYLNTPETPLFRKSSVLYGADLAKREIVHRRQAVIVEGYTDVMACHLAGVPTAVATSGTSFGEGHIKILRRLLMDADWQLAEVIFTFDGDAAGQRAALRAFHLEDRFATQTFVAVQADGLDPCDLRLQQGDAAVRDLIARRLPVYEFAIRSEIAKHNLDTNEGRLAALDAAAPIVGRIKDRGLRDRYAVSLDRWLGMLNEDFVLARVRAHAPAEPGGRAASGSRMAASRGNGSRAGGPAGPGGPGQPGSAPGQPPGAAAAAPYDANDPVVNLERQALKLAIQRPALCGPVFDALAAGDFTVPVHGAVRELIAGCGGVAGGAVGPGVGRAADRRGAQRPGPGVRDPAGGGADRGAAQGRGTGRPVRRGGAGPGGGPDRDPADQHAQVAAAAAQPGGAPGLQPDVRRPGGAGAAAQGPAGPGVRDVLIEPPSPGPRGWWRVWCGWCLRRSAVTDGLTWPGALDRFSWLSCYLPSR